jgi:hypothetical protein
VATKDHRGRGRGIAWAASESQEVGKPLKRTLYGFVDEFTLDDPAPVSIIRFEVPNFPKFFGRVIGVKDGDEMILLHRMLVDAGEFRLNLEGKPGIDGLIGNFGRLGGYGLTHVGEIQRTNGKPILFEEVERLWEDLAWWLSMLRSERTGPVIMLGIHDESIVWERWKLPVIEQWNGRVTWLPLGAPSSQDGSFPGGAAIFDSIRRMDHHSQERGVIERAIGWYTQSVQAKDMDPAVIMAQAGLELLAWLRLISEVGLSESGYENLHAADRLRLALNYAYIPAGVPEIATHLHLASRRRPDGSPELDGPDVITQLRNSLVPQRGRLDLVTRTSYLKVDAWPSDT